MSIYEEEGEIIPDSDTQIFLCGIAVTRQKMYKKIIAWRPEISYALPMIYVLSKNKLWMQIQMPRRSFEDDIMSTLIIVHCLHFLKWNLKADGSALWAQLHKAFSTYEVAPSKSHLLSHLPLIQEAVNRDKDLAKSKCFWRLVLVSCEDKCLNINSGAESFCESLGYSDAQVEAIQTFFCHNCQYQQHQWFVCGKLGSSDQSSSPETPNVVEGSGEQVKRPSHGPNWLLGRSGKCRKTNQDLQQKPLSSSTLLDMNDLKKTMREEIMAEM